MKSKLKDIKPEQKWMSKQTLFEKKQYSRTQQKSTRSRERNFSRAMLNFQWVKSNLHSSFDYLNGVNITDWSLKQKIAAQTKRVNININKGYLDVPRSQPYPLWEIPKKSILTSPKKSGYLWVRKSPRIPWTHGPPSNGPTEKSHGGHLELGEGFLTEEIHTGFLFL